MIDVLSVGVGVGLAGCLVGLLLPMLRAAQQRKADFEALLVKQEWSKTPTHPGGGVLNKGQRSWAFYGQSSQGVDWEVYLLQPQKGHSELCFRAYNLKLPQLELAVGPKADLGKIQQALPQIEKLANSMIGQMMMAMAEQYSSRAGASVVDLLSFLKTAEEKKVGSTAFQSLYSVLTRGTIPIENVLTAQAQSSIEGWRSRHFHLSWGIYGLSFHIRASSSECYQLGPKMVRLGEMLTGSQGT